MNQPMRVCLNPKKPLLEEVVDWLCKNRIKEVEGAKSLAHVMVVVPTAQSGRNLRLALAKCCGSVLPPKVVMPMQLVKPADAMPRGANSIEAAIAFQQYVKTHKSEVMALDRIVWPGAFEDLSARFTLFDQLEDIWRALAGSGLLMREVLNCAKDVIDKDVGDEVLRWKQLAELEKGYFDYLHSHGVSHPSELVHAAKNKPAIVDAEIEEIVLPAIADPVRVFGDVLERQVSAGKRITVLLHAKPEDADRFGKWGWPETPKWIGDARPILSNLADEDIVCATNTSAVARLVAYDFPSTGQNQLLPNLTICDEDLYQPVASAFLNRGYVVHSPERHDLLQSSLGQLLENLIPLYDCEDLPWNEFMFVLRSYDVQTALELDANDRVLVLKGADVAQNAFIPRSIPTGFAFPDENGIAKWQLKAFNAFCAFGKKLEAVLKSARSGATLGLFLRRVLQQVFSQHHNGDRANEKEFLAAAEGVRGFLEDIDSDFVEALAPTTSECEALARRALEAVVYSHEPDTVDAVKAEGWLELPWSTSRQVSLVGLHEGKVPDSIVGHPFLPDRLRAALGLVTNDDRLARDSWILKELLDSRNGGEDGCWHNVRIYIARASDSGDICRPSRLLYLCDDMNLAKRVKSLFGDLPIERTDKRRLVEWPLSIKATIVKPNHLSASALDTYVKCPFTYLLKYGLKMDVFKEKRELEANDFGTFIHEVLERYAKLQIASGDDQLTDASEIRRVILEEIVPVCSARFAHPTLNISLQLKAAEGRLALFAEHQAKWAQQGWRIRDAEYKLDDEIKELGVRIKGSIDRVDKNINEGVPKHWCLIDYKTWDAKNLTGHIVTSAKETSRNDEQLALARQLGFPRISNNKGRECQRMLSVQLPVYGKGYEATHPDIAFADMLFSYFILGKNGDETGVGEKKTMLSESQVAASVETAKRAVKLIEEGIFWPPGPTDEWNRDYSGLFVVGPKEDLAGTEWVKLQEQKLGDFHV